MAIDAPRLVLASGSPRRSELLRQAGYSFEICPPEDDGLSQDPEPAGRVSDLARNKALAGCRLAPKRWVLAADTLVWLDREPLGKPADRQQAAQMLERLSGREHEVWTGVCLANPSGQLFEQADVAVVSFREPPAAEIEAYLDGEEWTDKAGAYAIQGWAGAWTDLVSGEFETVVGLRLATVRELLSRAGACSAASNS